jgi:radical SAM protein with 4Fe4S-binding SPASM domain
VKISCKIADTGLLDFQKQKFLDDFSDRCDFIAVEGLHGWSTSELYDWKLGTDQSFDGTPRRNKIACPLVLYMLTVSSNGDVSICNDDAFHLHQIGNVNDETITDIWNGQRLRDFRRLHLSGNRNDNAACRNCDYMQALPDNIDGHLDELLNKLA